MTNPYTAPNNLPHETSTLPLWYVWFCKVYWPVWWAGSALVVGSWFGFVNAKFGWMGFGMACAASFGSYVLPTLTGVRRMDNVILDSRFLKTKGSQYHDAINRFQYGANLIYDGIAFSFRSSSDISCRVVVDSAELNDSSVAEAAVHAQSIFNHLIGESPEFASLVSACTFRVSIMSSLDANARELCEIVEGEVTWHN